MPNPQLKKNLRGILVHAVSEDELATHWRNDVPVLATPILLWLAELSAMRAIENAIPAGQMTLGYGHNIRHLAPTPLGWTITLEAKLAKIEDKLLTFQIEGRDSEGLILSGAHTRAIVDKAHFLQRLATKCARHEPQS